MGSLCSCGAGLDSNSFWWSLKHGLKYSCLQLWIKKIVTAAAELICMQLQVKWVFIEMTPALIRRFSKSEVYRDYCKFAFTGDSIPFIQDLYAVDFLLNTLKLVDDNSVFINGNSGDFISGGHIPSALHRLDHIPLGVSEIEFTADEYIKKHFAL